MLLTWNTLSHDSETDPGPHLFWPRKFKIFLVTAFAFNVSIDQKQPCPSIGK